MTVYPIITETIIDESSFCAIIHQTGCTVGKRRKFFERLMRGAADADIGFEDLCNLLIQMGFDERIRGDHHIFTRDDIIEILNLQPKGAKAKPYQVKQVRDLFRRYELNLEDDK